MTWANVAIGAGTLISGYLANSSSKKAAGAVGDASAAAITENRRQFDLVRSDTAGQRFLGNSAIDRLSRLYGYGPAPRAPLNGPGSEAFAGAAPAGQLPATYKPGALNSGAGAILNPYTVTSKLGDARYVLDPAGKIFGNLFGGGHGDEKRNLSAFAAESGVMQLPDGRLALPNGAIFDQSRLKDVAGTWYGAVHAPDGDQAGWQQRYNSLTASLGGGQTQGNAGGGLTSDGVPNSAPMSAGPVTIDNATGAVTPGNGSPDMSQFFTSPDYQFRLSEGQNAIDRSAAARGGLLSGRTVKAGEKYASNLASGEYGAFVDRLMQQAGLGSNGVAASAAAGANATGNITQAITNNGNSRASSYLQGAEGVNNSIQGGLQNLLLSRYLKPTGTGP